MKVSFWVVIFEQEGIGSRTAARAVFGVEPSPAEVYEFILRRYPRQVRYSRSGVKSASEPRPVNPKRALHKARRQKEQSLRTKAQEMLRLEQEAQKLERKSVSRVKRLEEAERKFALRQAKRKAKHRGH